MRRNLQLVVALALASLILSGAGCCGVLEPTNKREVEGWVHLEIPPGTTSAEAESAMKRHGFDLFSYQQHSGADGVVNVIAGKQYLGFCCFFDVHYIFVRASLGNDGCVKSVWVEDAHRLPI